MYRFFGDQLAYDSLNYIAYLATMISSLFYYKSKRKALGLYSKRIVCYTTELNTYFGKITEFVLVSVESLLMALMVDVSARVNQPFGEFVGTGANFFATLLVAPVLWFVLSVVLMINPLKQIDIATMFVPVTLFFYKAACYCQGCCWGIPWEYGPYNHHPDHPGNQVPVQAIEAFWAVAIFVFLLIYRKKAKPGTVYPIFVILYSATRFCSEFFRREENVFWILKRYHLLCLAGIAVGLLLLLIVELFGDKIQARFEKPHKEFELKIAQKEEEKAIKLAEEKAQAQANEIKRLENIRLAREKAKARKK